MNHSERARELCRRRKRRAKLKYWQTKLAKASASEKEAIAAKLRRMTPGADTLIQSWGLEESDR